MNSREGRGMVTVLGLCAAIGVITVVATIAWGRGVFVPERAASAGGSAAGASEEYGKRLIAQTTEFLGPDVADPKMRYTQSRLACASCHIGAGLEPGNLSLVAALSRYPRISSRSGGNETIQDRINGCMVRSMNGRPLANDSREMVAMIAHLKFLGDQDAATGASQRKAHEPPASRRRTARPIRKPGSRYSRSDARLVTEKMEPGFRRPPTSFTVLYSRRSGDPTASTTERACIGS